MFFKRSQGKNPSSTKVKKCSTWKKRLLKLFLVLIILLAVLGLWTINWWRSLATVEKLDNYPLYVMRYYGDYGFKDFQSGLGVDGIYKWGFEQLYPPEDQASLDAHNNAWACSCFAALSSESDKVFGRNFDWSTKAALLLFTDPSDGYASVSMVDTTYLGHTGGDLEWWEILFCLGAPYIPFDGMNECGLAVGIMAIPHADGGSDPQKETIGTLGAIRLLLDHAANVDQAVTLLQKYNLTFERGPTVHYMISDATGKSVIVEFLSGKPEIIPNTQPWQVSTNFIFTDKSPDQILASCPRYQHAWQRLQQSKGQLNPKEAMSLLNEVSQDCTAWSIVYGLSNGDISVAAGKNYHQTHNYHLNMKNESVIEP
ncbi:MAG: linear amide C-N hydrolase [Sedimentisphaerales bacterium]|nr:linear amide C-N hydrolase [Sedimentisphaerales bacterium]